MSTTLVKRPARITPPSAQTSPLAIEAPPMRGQAAPAMAGASMMMMPIMSGTGSVAVAITQRGRPIVAVAAMLALVGSIAIGALMMISQRSGTKRQVREGRERYLDYIEGLRHTVRDQIADQRAEQSWRHPRTDELLDISRDHARRWERRPSHADFLAVRLGTGEVPLASGLTLDADTGPLNDFDPVCLQAAQRLIERYAVLRDQPIVLGLAGIGQTSVIGRAPLRRALASNLTIGSPRCTAPTTSRSRWSAPTTRQPTGTGSSGSPTSSRAAHSTATCRHGGSRPVSRPWPSCWPPSSRSASTSCSGPAATPRASAPTSSS
ncbi:hypothetical protein [Aeromicrobium sp. UC242_57]|uniref:hypothetical protein n=1 Tax=Aeromicrobium sp. UC242_57 TaxID=3374624 RepID=UPI0037A7C838